MTPTPGQWRITPIGFMNIATSQNVLSRDPIGDCYMRMQPGETADLIAGDYPRATLKKPVRAPDSLPVLLRGAAAAEGVTQVLADQLVGGSSSLVFMPGAGNVKFSRIKFQGDDRSALFTEKGGVANVWFQGCSIVGPGSPYLSSWKNNCKWGARVYDTDNWTFDGLTVESIFQEHAWYADCIAGDYHFRSFSIAHCGRTAFQFVNRPPPDGTNPGKGNLLFENGNILDVCLEQGGGGSAFTFRGGMPETIVNIKDVTVLLGCDPKLAAPFNQYITGGLVCDIGSPSFPGGLKELHFTNFNSFIGTVYPGVAGAKRSNVKVSHCELFTIVGGILEQGPMAHQIALEVEASCLKLLIDPTAKIIGQIKYGADPSIGKPGTIYQNLAQFLTDHHECAA